MADSTIQTATVPVPGGALNVARAGTGPAIALFHQTPRSWDEYRDVLPLLAEAGYCALAFDTPGFGDSPPLAGPPSVVAWATAMGHGLDALGIERVALAGHHTGSFVAVELAAQRPAAVAAVVISAGGLNDAEQRAAVLGDVPIDLGDDFATLRRSREPYYPADRPDLLDRYARDALKAGALARDGHGVAMAYEMEHAVPALSMPVLLIDATADPFTYPHHAPRLQRALPHAELVEIDGGIPLPDGWPEEFSTAVRRFLDRVYPPAR